MDVSIHLSDSYEWFDDIFNMPIDESAIMLFSNLGYVEEDSTALLKACNSRAFVYDLMPRDGVLDEEDHLHLETISSASYLFRFDGNAYAETGPDVVFYAVDMMDVGHDRSTEAYAIHCIIAKFEKVRSVVLFRHGLTFMLSFLTPLENGGINIRLSDWIAVDDPDVGQLDCIHIALMPSKSAVACFEGIMAESIRGYYGERKTRISRLDELVSACDVIWEDNPPFYSREEMYELVENMRYSYLDDYGDDFIEDRVEYIDTGENFNLEQIEWELQNQFDMTLPTFDEYDDEDLSLGESFEDIPDDDTMDDPDALLEWLSGHPTDFSHEGKPLVNERTANNRKAKKSSSNNSKFYIINWDESMAESMPKKGMWVRHTELGDGRVVYSSGNQISVAFKNTNRLFVYPYAFRSGSLTLLGCY